MLEVALPVLKMLFGGRILHSHQRLRNPNYITTVLCAILVLAQVGGINHVGMGLKLNWTELPFPGSNLRVCKSSYYK